MRVSPLTIGLVVTAVSTVSLPAMTLADWRIRAISLQHRPSPNSSKNILPEKSRHADEVEQLERQAQAIGVAGTDPRTRFANSDPRGGESL